MFLEISQNSQEHTCAGVFSLEKLLALACNLIKREALAHVFSCKFCKISENAFSYKIPPLAASERAIWFSDIGFKERERERERENETERQRETETERELKGTAAHRNSITISYINAIK